MHVRCSYVVQLEEFLVFKAISSLEVTRWDDTVSVVTTAQQRRHPHAGLHALDALVALHHLALQAATTVTCQSHFVDCRVYFVSEFHFV